MVGQREGRIRHLHQRALVAWALVVSVVLGLTAVGGEARARGDGAAAGAPVEPLMPVAPVAPLVVDQTSEVPLAPPLRLPLLGPRYAVVTLDLFVAAGQKGGDVNLGLALRRVHEEPDVRLVLHPVTGGPLAERRAEVIWEAFEQQPARCFEFISQLLNTPSGWR